MKIIKLLRPMQHRIMIMIEDTFLFTTANKIKKVRTCSVLNYYCDGIYCDLTRDGIKISVDGIKCLNMNACETVAQLLK